MGGRFALCAALALVTGCGPPKPPLVDFSETPRGLVGHDYPRVYRHWTRHEKVLHGLDPAIEVWATLKSWEFREAFLSRYAEIYRVPEPRRVELRSFELGQAREGFEFLVTAQSAKFQWNDFERPNSAWKITLVDGTGRELDPDKIEIPRLPDAYLESFYPDRTPFSRTYLVRFARPGGREFLGPRTGRLMLRIASPIGTAELIWQSSR